VTNPMRFMLGKWQEPFTLFQNLARDHSRLGMNGTFDFHLSLRNVEDLRHGVGSISVTKVVRPHGSDRSGITFAHKSGSRAQVDAKKSAVAVALWMRFVEDTRREAYLCEL